MHCWTPKMHCWVPKIYFFVRNICLVQKINLGTKIHFFVPKNAFMGTKNVFWGSTNSFWVPIQNNKKYPKLKEKTIKSIKV